MSTNEPFVASVLETRDRDRDRWLLMSVFSWIIPILAGVGALFLVITQGNLAQYWLSWVMLGIMLVIGVVLSVGPLAFNANRRWTAAKTNAVVGVLFNMCAWGWVALCLLVAVFITIEQSPARRRAIADARAEERRLEAERKQQLQRERQAQAELNAVRQREEFERQFQEYLVHREEQIVARNEEVIRRFYAGGDHTKIPEVPHPGRRYLEEFEVPPIPPIGPHPVRYTEHSVEVTQVDREFASASWSVVGGLSIRNLNLASTERGRCKLMRKDASEVIYFGLGQTISEIDTSSWRRLRTIDLGGTFTDIARSRDWIVVAINNPGMVLLLDPQSLETKRAIPIQDVQQVAAYQGSNRIYVRLKTTAGNFSLAAINLETDQVESIMRLVDAVRAGGNMKADVHQYSQLYQIGLTDDGKYMWALGDRVCRWSLDDGRMNCLEVSNVSIHERYARSVSPNGRFFSTTNGVFDVTRSITNPVATNAAFRKSAITNDGEQFAFSDTHDEFRELNIRGTTLYEHDWSRTGRSGEVLAVHGLPQPDQWVVQTRDGWMLVAKSSATASNSPQENPTETQPPESSPVALRVVADEWPAGDAEALSVEPLPAVDGVASVRLAGARLACFSGDGNSAYAVAGQRLAKISAETNEVDKVVQIPNEVEIKHLFFSAAGVIAAGGQPLRIWVLDPATLEVARCIYTPPLSELEKAGDGEITTAPGSPLLLVRAKGNYLTTINVETGALVSEVPLVELKGPSYEGGSFHPRDVMLCMTPDGKRLVSSFSGGVHCCDITANGFTNHRESNKLSRTSMLRVSGDSSRAALKTSKAGVLIYELDDLAEPIGRVPFSATSEAATLDGPGESLWTAGLHRYRPGQLNSASIPLADEADRSLAISPNGQRLLAVGAADSLLIDISGWTTPEAPLQPAGDLKRLAITEEDFTITAENRSIVRQRIELDGAQITLLEYDRGNSYTAYGRFSPDGKWIYTQRDRNTLQQVDAEDLTARRSIKLNSGPGIISFYPAAGGLALACLNAKEPRIWICDLDTLEPQHVLSLPQLGSRERGNFNIARDAPLAFWCRDNVLSVIDLKSSRVLDRCDLILAHYQTGAGSSLGPRSITASDDGSQVFCLPYGPLVSWDGKKLNAKPVARLNGVYAHRGLLWQPDQRRLVGISNNIVKQGEPEAERRYLPLRAVGPSEKPVDLLPLPEGVPDRGFSTKLSEDRLWIFTPGQDSAKSQFATVTLDGHATRAVETSYKVYQYEVAPRGPRLLAREPQGEFYLLELKE